MRGRSGIARHGRSLLFRGPLLGGLIASLLLGACRGVMPATVTRSPAVRCYLESSAGDAVPFVLPQSHVRILAGPRPVLDGDAVADADVAQLDLGSALMLRLSPAGARELAAVSAASIGRRLIITSDGVPIGARRIESPITNGLLFAFVELPDTGLAELVARLKGGGSDQRVRFRIE
ncbi:MAG TPA: hypothetical protein VHE61_07650 [Opitutaceae bacterium]|nr:hypothetical protein [Opitutaceae bacterium]